MYKDIEKIKEYAPDSRERYLKQIASFNKMYGLQRAENQRMKNSHERRAINSLIQGGIIK
ncbi:gp135 [Bacillus phage W.Ph.]|uniref:Gp135 n=1 Tax=Bacillus phage W.Ph. TaxID=764595 RepID=G9B1N6_9CAUD|nr:gp135 [Bacillus phage W.Ph.]ADH03281.1 gp135 [Bacillus phage W.Ph.]